MKNVRSCRRYPIYGALGRLFVAVSIIASAFATTAPHAQTASAYSFERCYELALARSKTMAGQIELIEQAAARISQARAPFLPTLSVGGTILRQETPNSVLAQSLSPAQQETIRASATQNLFKGFRDLATLRQRRLAHRAAEFGREQAGVQLFIDVAQAFYEVLNREAQLQTYRDEVAANTERRRELLQFRRTARARDTDVAAVEAAIATLEAAMTNARGLRDVARETLAFLTGLPADAVLADSDNIAWAAIAPLDWWLAGVAGRADIRQAQTNMEASRENIRAARAGAGPSIDVSANYYFRRPGISEEIDWDVQLSISQPIFTGGLVQAQVREAVAQRRANEIALAQAQEAAEHDIRSFYRTLQANIEQLQTSERAVELTERNYELLRKDNRAGLATHLDVLQALASVYQARRTRETARYATKITYARLLATAARHEADNDVRTRSAWPQRQ